MRGGGQREEEDNERRRRGEEEEEDQATDIKSNNPHLAGGEKDQSYINIPFRSHEFKFCLYFFRSGALSSKS